MCSSDLGAGEAAQGAPVREGLDLDVVAGEVNVVVHLLSPPSEVFWPVGNPRFIPGGGSCAERRQAGITGEWAGGGAQELLAEQAARFRPAHLGVLDAAGADELRRMLPVGYAPHIHTGQDGYMTLAALPEVDLVLAAQVGAAGLMPALAAARAGKVLCLANKEALVLAGELFRRIASIQLLFGSTGRILFK